MTMPLSGSAAGRLAAQGVLRDEGAEARDRVGEAFVSQVGDGLADGVPAGAGEVLQVFL